MALNAAPDARAPQAAQVVAEHFDAPGLLKEVLGRNARRKIKKADRKLLARFLTHRATTRLTDWIGTLPAEGSVKLEPRSVELDPSSARKVIATFDLSVGDGAHHLVEVRARRGKKRGAPWKIWDVRCGAAGVHLTRQYKAQFRALTREGGLVGLVEKARGLTP